MQFALSFQQVRRDNPGDKIPQFFGRPRTYSREIYAYRAIAMFLLTLSFFAWMGLLGIWAVLLILLGGVPAAVLNVQHNRRVQGLPDPTTRRETT